MERFIAIQHLTWGNDVIHPGESVPVDPSRDYEGMVALGQIARVEGKSLVETTAKRNAWRNNRAKAETAKAPSKK